MSCAFIGCGALFKGTTQTVGIKTSQQGSAIEVDGVTYTSPALVELKRNMDYVVTISKEGYETRQVKIRRKVSGGIVVLDILGGLLPVIIDAVMGTWNNLEPKEINVNLVSKETGALDIPVKIIPTSDVSLKIVSPQSIQIKVESIRAE